MTDEKKHISIAEGATVYSSLDSSCSDCLNAGKEGKATCPSDNKIKRTGIFKDQEISLFYCTANPNHIKSSKTFRKELRIIGESVRDALHYYQSATEKILFESKQLHHNLIEINARQKQGIEKFMPLVKIIEAPGYKEQKAIIADEITKNKDAAINLILDVIKHNKAMQTEFDAFLKLRTIKPVMNFKLHRIRQVIDNEISAFIKEYRDKGIKLKIQECKTLLTFDYESLRVVIYHLLDNASKYILPLSQFTIDFFIDNGEFVIQFNMISLKITAEDKNRIFEDGYSGEYPKLIGVSGTGLGMGIVKQLIEQNKGRIVIHENADPTKNKTYDNQPYENNIFEIRFQDK